MNVNRRDAEQDAQRLRTVFSKDNRFNFLGLVSFGAFGSAHHVRYVDNQRGTATDFLVKKAFSDSISEEALQNERKYLRIFKGAMHLVQLIDIPANPLASSDLQWLVLEWLPNGTLGDFVTKAKEKGAERLPNRLLWRFFLCLIRACVGMAYPKGRTDDLLELETLPRAPPGENYFQPKQFAHNDIDDTNVLLGDFLPYGEHGITPIVKFIDFGGTEDEEPDPETGETAVQMNIREIGTLMAGIITFQRHLNLNFSTPITIKITGVDIQTRAGLLFPNFPDDPRPLAGLDEWLAGIIAMCLAVDPAMRPTLPQLVNWVLYYVRNSTAEVYNDPSETDAAIKDGCRRILFDAPTQ
ncbi:kinase-like protein [Hypoxylon sp. FL0890]|nr:kinase-like protein [Hypoxylon sp. FL0890]